MATLYKKGLRHSSKSFSYSNFGEPAALYNNKPHITNDFKKYLFIFRSIKNKLKESTRIGCFLAIQGRLWGALLRKAKMLANPKMLYRKSLFYLIIKQIKPSKHHPAS